jgi:4-amino-4-deoxy-L-arabinose transferase-like glycosyltransferase
VIIRYGNVLSSSSRALYFGWMSLISRFSASRASTSESVWITSKSTTLSSSPAFLCSSLVDGWKYDPTRSRREADLPT